MIKTRVVTLGRFVELILQSKVATLAYLPCTYINNENLNGSIRIVIRDLVCFSNYLFIYSLIPNYLEISNVSIF